MTHFEYLLIVQSVPRMPSDFRFCVPEHVLGGHERRKGQTDRRLQRCPVEEGLQVFQTGPWQVPIRQ